METVTLNVKGMTCMGCVKSVKNVLEPIAGVAGVDVSLDKAQATIRFDPARAGKAKFKAAIEGAGYEVAG
ncbi:MAG: heavy-metal-associated domain-containing protein [Betaproteobacteria bacterium]|nr:heavy-metal-associated domain-containing protein [Betaproteobacteria bacterium]